MDKRPGETCASCQFLMKTYHNVGVHSPHGLSEQEVSKAESNDFSWVGSGWNLGCIKGVWDEGYQMSAARFQTIVLADRRDFCFYFRRRPGMMNPAAEELQKREAEAKEAAHDRKLTQKSLRIAIAAIVVQAILQALSIGLQTFEVMRKAPGGKDEPPIAARPQDKAPHAEPSQPQRP